MRASASRMPLLLGLFALGKPVTHELLLRHTGWEPNICSGTISNAKTHGYIVQAEPITRGNQAYEITAAGREKAGLMGEASASDANLADCAIALIVASEAGLDSGQIADKLGRSNEQVMAALDQAADDHRVVACRLVRDGIEMRQYRKSAGAPLLTPWHKPLAANAPARAIAAARARHDLANGVDIDAAHRVPSTGRIDKLTPPAAAAALDSATKSRVDDLAEKIVALSEEEATLDDDGREQWFCLYSSGELCIQRTDGSQVSLSADETRALFAWLDRLGGTDLQRLAQPEAAAT